MAFFFCLLTDHGRSVRCRNFSISIAIRERYNLSNVTLRLVKGAHVNGARPTSTKSHWSFSLEQVDEDSRDHTLWYTAVRSRRAMFEIFLIAVDHFPDRSQPEGQVNIRATCYHCRDMEVTGFVALVAFCGSHPASPMTQRSIENCTIPEDTEKVDAFAHGSDSYKHVKDHHNIVCETTEEGRTIATRLCPVSCLQTAGTVGTISTTAEAPTTGTFPSGSPPAREVPAVSPVPAPVQETTPVNGAVDIPSQCDCAVNYTMQPINDELPDRIYAAPSGKRVSKYKKAYCCCNHECPHTSVISSIKCNVTEPEPRLFRHIDCEDCAPLKRDVHKRCVRI